ncbi:MAG: RluA family pseudouridine synthase [Flavobacteriales bacterium]|nr:RluA family pseudouridine synthase [Flavobacteriales bacterium]
MIENNEINLQEDELYEHHRFVADKGQEPLRVDKFLMNFVENATRNKIQNAAKSGNILVNGNAVKQNYRVKANDIVTVVLAHPPRELKLIPENIPLNIVYEDDDVLVVNKDAGMVVHPGHGNYTGTLVNALTYHFSSLPNLNCELHDRPGLVHRIDKDTSGLLVIAKNEYAMTNLAKQFFDRKTHRLYYALVWGNFEEDFGTIEGHIGRDLKDRMIMSVFPNGEHGKPAITHYKVIERFKYVTLIECKLETGRTHQIRAHMKYLKHPLFNDERYGGNDILKGTTFTKYKQFVENCFSILPRQALHAKTLGFMHPVTKKMLNFDSELPSDMQNAIEKWRKYSTTL